MSLSACEPHHFHMCGCTDTFSTVEVSHIQPDTTSFHTDSNFLRFTVAAAATTAWPRCVMSSGSSDDEAKCDGVNEICINKLYW